MEDELHNYVSTVMFRGTLCINIYMSEELYYIDKLACMLKFTIVDTGLK